jgi:hypothetical protein
MTTDELLKQVGAALEQRGLSAEIEYPGYLTVQTNTTVKLDFGFANGCLGWDVVSFDDNVESSGEEPLILPGCQDVELVTATVLRVYEEECV